MQIVKCKRGQFAKLQTQPGFVYCGRACYDYSGSVLGNPFIVGKDGTLSEVLAKYRQYLWKLVNTTDDKLWLQVWDNINEWSEYTILGCWCVDKEAGTGEEQCHCDVLCKFWRWAETQR